jgi:hypothetical protein
MAARTKASALYLHPALPVGGGTKKRKVRVSRGGKRSPDSGSARRELSKSGLVFFVAEP